MPLTGLQAQILKFYYLKINQPVQMEVQIVNYIIISFEGNINIEDTTGLNLYLRATK